MPFWNNQIISGAGTTFKQYFPTFRCDSNQQAKHKQILWIGK